MKRIVPLAAFLALLLALIALRFPDYRMHANEWVIEAWGDGYKSYHAYQYHIRYDSTLSHFAGMNYPYGEHVIPGDTQPLLSNAVKMLIDLGLPLEGYLLGIFHAALLLGLFLCGLFLWLIFRDFGLPGWYAGIAALGITFLSPQLDRMESHFGLAHPELMPMLMYGLLRYHRRPHWGWSAAIGLVIWAYSLLHFYFFAIAAFLILSFMGVRWIRRRDWPLTGRYLLHGSLQLLAPFVFFFFWLYYGDPITDRTVEPWGFFNYRAHWEGVFTSLSQPHWRWVDEHLVAIRRVDMEGQAYVGLAALFFMLWWLAGAFRRQGAAPRLRSEEAERQEALQLLMGSGLLVLLFSLGLPFILPGGERLLEWLSPIRQFRSIGRFAWVFYYAVNIAAFTLLYDKAHARGGWRWGLVALALLTLSFESYRFARSHDLRLDPIEEMAPDRAFTAIDSLDFSRYQAILPVPYYNIGSDNYWWSLSGFIGQKTQTLSIQTGLPLTGAMLTRTSLGQTVNQLQMVMEPYRLPRLLNDLPNNKPLLMAWDEERLADQRPLYAHLLEGARQVYAQPPLYFYELPTATFAQRIQARRDTAHRRWQLLAPQGKGEWRTQDSAVHWAYWGFDERPSTKTYRGKGAFEGVMMEENVIMDTVLSLTGAPGELTFSCWMWLGADRYPRTDLWLLELDPDTGAERGRHIRQSREWVKTFDNNGWALLEWTVPATAAVSRWRFTLSNPALRRQPIWLDELLVRPSGSSVYRQRSGEVMVNNRYWK
jgi:hypothetical protein